MKERPLRLVRVEVRLRPRIFRDFLKVRPEDVDRMLRELEPVYQSADEAGRRAIIDTLLDFDYVQTDIYE